MARTLEELFEEITLKRLGIYHKPIVLLNARGYWTPWAEFMQRQVIDEGLRNPGHSAMWSVVDSIAGVLPAIANAPEWNEQARAGYVALFEIDDDRTVTALSVRQRREDDCH